jgi:hypothetical protein
MGKKAVGNVREAGHIHSSRQSRTARTQESLIYGCACRQIPKGRLVVLLEDHKAEYT